VRPDVKTRVFTLIVIFTQVFGNFALSWGLKHEPEGLSASPLAFVHAIFTPYVLLGISLLIVWLLTRMTLLSWADLSYVLPVTSIGYVLNTLIGKYFFDEKITPARWLGTLLIVAGIALVGSTCPRTTPAQLQEEA
jgi:drug/metabolite transporter (DMT)-like permease